MKPVENLVNLLENYILSFSNSEKYRVYLESVGDFPAFVFFASEMARNKRLEDFKEQEKIDELLVGFAENYTLMMWGKNYSGNTEELIKRVPFLKEENNSVEDKFKSLSEIVLATTNYCYENGYKAKYFNEYIINFKNSQHYLRGKSELPPVVAFDLDGTVVNSSERIRLMMERKDNLDENLSKKTKANKKFGIMKNFHSNVDTDKPYEHMVSLIKEYKKNGFDVMVLTARPNEYIDVNKEFIKKWDLPFDIYVGRPVNNGFPDTEGKYSWLNENVAKERVRGFFEDREEIIHYFNKKDKIHIYNVEDFHKNRTDEKRDSLVKDCLKRKNKCEDYFKLDMERDNYKYFYRKAEEYYEKRNGEPMSDMDKKFLIEKGRKLRPNIS